MALTYPYAECRWQVWHAPDGVQPHRAFRLRALLIGNFRPGRVIRGFMVIAPDGHPPRPLTDPVKCQVCDLVPDVNDLAVECRITGQRQWLAPYRRGLRKWPRPRWEDRCWWCQAPDSDVYADGLCPRCTSLRDGPPPGPPMPPEAPAVVQEPEPVLPGLEG